MKQLYQGVFAWVAGVLLVTAGAAAIAYFLDSKAAPSGAVSVSGESQQVGVQMRKDEEEFVDGRVTHDAILHVTEKCLAGRQFLIGDSGRTIVPVLDKNGGGRRCQK